MGQAYQITSIKHVKEEELSFNASKGVKKETVVIISF